MEQTRLHDWVASEVGSTVQWGMGLGGYRAMPAAMQQRRGWGGCSLGGALENHIKARDMKQKSQRWRAIMPAKWAAAFES